MPRNPNNCSTCLHKLLPEGGWCYMFKDEPTEVCMQHTGRKLFGLNSLSGFSIEAREHSVDVATSKE